MVALMPRLSMTGSLRADLEAIGVLLDHLEILGVQDLGDNGQAGRLARLGQQLESFDAQALEGVRRGPGLERAAAQHSGACLFDIGGNGDDLVAILNRAGSGNDNHLRSAKDDAADLDERGRLTKFVGNELVRLEDGSNRLDSGDGRQRLLADGVLRANDPDDDAHGAS